MNRFKLDPRGLAVCLATLGGPCLQAQDATFTRGDCNASGNALQGVSCELSDPVFLLNYLFIGGRTPPCLEACNANDDKRLDIGDAVYQLMYCFLGGAPPPPPVTGCGKDPTEPSPGCAEFPPCRTGRDCKAQDARGVGACEAIIGVFWDGSRCRYESGCSCEGEDCDQGFESLEECYAAYSDCGGVCAPMDARGTGDCKKILGWAWNGRQCRILPGCECEGVDCDRLHGSEDECLAAVTGCPSACRPMNVRGVGPCVAGLGTYWDGFRCATLSGCSCEGEDCDSLYDSAGECRIAHGMCPPTCAPMEARGVGPCDAVLGHYWDGASCQSVSGCSCEGLDCDRLTSLETCEAAHVRCPKPCEPMDADPVGTCEAIRGWHWDGRRCLPLVGCECKGEDCDQLFESQGECDAVNGGCPPFCKAMDVKGIGACRVILGFHWDGLTCQPLSACECEGADCDGLFASEEECRVELEGCQ